MGFPSGSVVPLPTANSHAKEKYLIEPAYQKAAFIFPPMQTHWAGYYIKNVGTPQEDNQLKESAYTP